MDMDFVIINSNDLKESESKNNSPIYNNNLEKNESNNLEKNNPIRALDHNVGPSRCEFVLHRKILCRLHQRMSQTHEI